MICYPPPLKSWGGYIPPTPRVRRPCPYLIYFVEVWGNAPKNYIEPITILLKKIVKLITFSKWYSYNKLLFDNLKIRNFETIVNLIIGLTMYKIHIGEVPKCISEIFQKNFTIHYYNTRSSSLSHFKEFMFGIKYLV